MRGRKQRKNLTGKIVLITGGSSGIGLAVAKQCASRGARVILAARNEARLASARDDILLTEDQLRRAAARIPAARYAQWFAALPDALHEPVFDAAPAVYG